MWECLRDKGIFVRDPAAWSLGGNRDAGEDMDPRGRALLGEALKSRGLRVIADRDLGRNTAERTAVFREAAGDKPIKVFVNIGGSWANLGTDESILKVKPGLSKPGDIFLPEDRGMIQEMAAAGIMVIHCLYIRGLVREFGLPWDPVPLPEPGEGRLYRLAREGLPAFRVMIVVYLICVVLLAMFLRRARL
jgi:poly-gamma-glutamate system protein